MSAWAKRRTSAGFVVLGLALALIGVCAIVTVPGCDSTGAGGFLDATLVAVPPAWLGALLLLAWGPERTRWGLARLGALVAVPAAYVALIGLILGCIDPS